MWDEPGRPNPEWYPGWDPAVGAEGERDPAFLPRPRVKVALVVVITVVMLVTLVALCMAAAEVAGLVTILP